MEPCLPSFFTTTLLLLFIYVDWKFEGAISTTSLTWVFYTSSLDILGESAGSERITQAILAKAFRGELVPQDPNDEPALVLLERIKKERRKQKKGKFQLS
jgi:hypothetical protein